jgi:hypothetical protein
MESCRECAVRINITMPRSEGTCCNKAAGSSTPQKLFDCCLNEKMDRHEQTRCATRNKQCRSDHRASERQQRRAIRSGKRATQCNKKSFNCMDDLTQERRFRTGNTGYQSRQLMFRARMSDRLKRKTMRVIGLEQAMTESKAQMSM